MKALSPAAAHKTDKDVGKMNANITENGKTITLSGA